MSTRNSRKLRNCDPCLNVGGVPLGTAPYLSQLIDNIDLRGEATKNTAPDFIVYTLATRGGIAYLADLNEWAIFTPSGFGSEQSNGLLPRRVKIWSFTRNTWSEELDCEQANIKIFPANATFYPVSDKIGELVESLDTVEDNISQNLDNLRQMAVTVIKDKQLQRQLTLLNKQRLNGQSHGVLLLPQTDEKDLLNLTTAQEAVTVVTLSPNAENYLSDYLALKEDYRQELHNIIGVTEIAEKSERRINSEMELIENSTYAFIDMIISNINKYAKYHKVDIYAHRAHSACNEHADPAVDEQSELNEEASNNDNKEQQGE